MSTEPHQITRFAEQGFWEQGHSPALSPLDGRYHATAAPLANWLSEDALNRARLHVEAAWIEFLTDSGIIPGCEPLSTKQRNYLYQLSLDFNEQRRTRLAELESETRHDVKAVEYLVREHMLAGDPKLAGLVELAHFLCTSEDINNLSYALCVREALHQVWIPAADGLVADLRKIASATADIPMLARTHGQPATPTTVGKELAVFVSRLESQASHIKGTPILGKLNGATGTYSAHVAVLPKVDWQQASQQFVESLGLVWNPLTTQIEPHDWQIRLYTELEHFNLIAHNLATDCWQYISLGYFKQRSEGSTGSSTMPHKINPIRFENAEANLEMSNAVLGALATNLATTRMQRDLTDSSLQRNIGVGFGYSLVAIENLRGGLARLDVDTDLVLRDLNAHPEVLSEAIQQALRLAALTGSEASEEPYTLLKTITRGHMVSLEDMRDVIRNADMSTELRSRLLAMTPADYTGLAPKLVDSAED